MRIVVTGVGMVSALGIGVDKNLLSIQHDESGISLFPRILHTDHKMPVGELQLTNEQLHELAEIPLSAHLSRTALLGILAVREALKDAKVDTAKRIGLVSSTSVGGMDLTEHFFKYYMENDATGRLRDVRMHDCAASTEAIKKYCTINAYTTTISTACSSAANAIIHGTKLLIHNIVDCVVVGGCDALSAFTVNGFESLRILDDRPCRPFDNNRNGLNLGEGAGYLVLQREEEVDWFYGYLAGFSNKNDAYHQTASSVTGDGAYYAMQEALKVARLFPQDVSYINAHGTGTGNNDASESAAFIRLFGKNVPPFSSTKGFTGHTLAAAGGLEAVLSVMALRHGILYPNHNYETPMESYGLEPVTQYTPNVDVKCVLSNSFGFGGNCSSLVFVR